MSRDPSLERNKTPVTGKTEPTTARCLSASLLPYTGPVVLIGVISSRIVCKHITHWTNLMKPSWKLDPPLENTLSISSFQLSCFQPPEKAMFSSQFVARMDTVHTGLEMALVFVPGHLRVALTMISYDVFGYCTLTDVSSIVSTMPSSSGVTSICSLGFRDDASFEGAASETRYLRSSSQAGFGRTGSFTTTSRFQSCFLCRHALV